MSDITVSQQLEKVWGYYDGLYASYLISIGVECGLFEAMEGRKAVSASELAAKLGLHEPYIEVWCQTAYRFELLDVDSESKYVMQPHLDEILVDKSSLRYQGAFFRFHVESAHGLLSNIPEYYKSGETIGLPEMSADLGRPLMNALHKQYSLFLNQLSDQDRLKKKLIQPFKLLDIGCFSGGFIIKLAQEYPHAFFWGIDSDSYVINTAEKQIKELGLAQMVSVEAIGGQDINYIEEFDIITLCLTLHEIPLDIKDTVLQKAYSALKLDGVLLIIEIAYPGQIEDFRGPRYRHGIIDQFMETAMGTHHMTEYEQEQKLLEIGFKDIQRINQGLDFITAVK